MCIIMYEYGVTLVFQRPDFRGLFGYLSTFNPPTTPSFSYLYV